MARVKIGNVRQPIDYLKQFFAPVGYTASYYTAGTNEDIDSVLKSAIGKLKSFEKCYIDLAVVHSELDLPSDNWMCLLERSFDNECIITATNRYHIAKRFYQAGVFANWLWLNPPMFLGVEYCTTERWNDRPVYTMLVDCGTTVEGTTKKALPFTGTPIRYSASAGGLVSPYRPNGSEVYRFEVDVGGSEITLTVGSGEVGKNAYVQVWYLK